MTTKAIVTSGNHKHECITNYVIFKDINLYGKVIAESFNNVESIKE